MVRRLPALALLLAAFPALAEPLAITTTSLGEAFLGIAFDRRLEATGGTPPYAWSLLESGPPGVRLQADGTIDGKPGEVGEFRLRVQVMDAEDAFDRRTFTVKVVDPAAPLEILTAELPPAFGGMPYSVQLLGQGGVAPHTWTVEAGAPPWLEMSSGVLNGTPEPDHVGTSSRLTLRLTDERGIFVEKELPLAVLAPMDFRIVTATLPDAFTGAPYRGDVKASGGVPPYTFEIEGLPSGLTGSTEGEVHVVSGTPEVTGVFELLVEARDGEGRFAARRLFLSCLEGGGIDIVTEELPLAKVGASYAVRLVSEPAHASWSLTSGSLPPGLELAEDGVISGRPGTAAADLTFGFTVRAVVGSGAGSRPLSITVLTAEPPAADEEGGCTAPAGPIALLGLVAVSASRRRRSAA